MTKDAWNAHSWKTISVSHIGVTRITMQNYAMGSALLMSIFFCTLFAAIGLFFCSISMNSTYAQIEVTTDENISSPIFNRTVSQDSEPKPDILNSALHSDTMVGEVLNNFTYPIEDVFITASVYDKNGVLVATGETYASDYHIKPNGTIFLTVGTGGAEIHNFIGKARYIAEQLESHGFLNVDIASSKKELTLLGTFYENTDMIKKDQFIITKQK